MPWWRITLFLLPLLGVLVPSLAGSARGNSGADAVSIVMVMMIRDEEANLRNNLGLWLEHIDYFVFGIDSKTSDQSLQAISDVLPRGRPRSVFHFKFDGFGQARTLLMKEAWQKFPQATHLLIGDPDWIPELSTIRKGDIDHNHDYFQFQIWDRNNLTTRQSDWLMKHREGIWMKYRLHEVLVYPKAETTTKEIAWQVYEVETPTSWHVTSGHGHSQSYGRFLFDLDLLDKDLRDERVNPSDHTLYYLGITNFALVEARMSMLQQHSHGQDVGAKAQALKEADQRVKSGLYFLHQRIDRHLDSPNWEQTWATMRWLAYSYQLFMNDFESANHWYERCTSFDPERVDCPIFQARLNLDHSRPQDAWASCVKALSSTYPVRAFGNNFYIYDCFTPVEAAKTLLALLQEQGYRRGWFTLGWRLVNYAMVKCDRGIMLEADDILDILRGSYSAMAYANGLTPEDAASCLPAVGADLERDLLEKRLGVRLHVCQDHTTNDVSSLKTGQDVEYEAPLNEAEAQTYMHAGYRIGPTREWKKLAADYVDANRVSRRQPDAPSRPLIDLVASGARDILQTRHLGSADSHARELGDAADVIGRDSNNTTFLPFDINSDLPLHRDLVEPHPWLLGLDVISHYLFRGARDWTKSFDALVVGDDGAMHLRLLRDQLEALRCPYRLTYTHEDDELLVDVAKLFEDQPSVRVHWLDGRWDVTRWGKFDYIHVSYSLNRGPQDPRLLLEGVTKLLKADGGMGIDVFAKNSFLDANQHFRELLSSKVSLAEDEVRKLLSSFAAEAQADKAHMAGDRILLDAGMYEMAPRILRTFTISDISNILQTAGLTLASVMGGTFYEPSNYVGETSLVSTLDSLAPEDRFSVGEFFVPRSRHVLFAVNKDAANTGVLGEVVVELPEMLNMIPVPVHAEAHADLTASLAIAGETVLRTQIPCSTEMYEWMISPLAAQVMRQVDGSRDVMSIYNNLREGIVGDNIDNKMQTFIEEFQALMTVTTALNLVVLRSRPNKNSPLQFQGAPMDQMKRYEDGRDQVSSASNSEATGLRSSIRDVVPSGLSTEHNDLMALSDLLQRNFSMSVRSSRLAEDLCDECHPLHPDAPARMADFQTGAKYKFEHDVEQFRYLASRGFRAVWLTKTIIPAYLQVLEAHKPLPYNAVVTLSPVENAVLTGAYNRAVHLVNGPPLPSDEVLNSNIDFCHKESQYLAHEHGFVVVDDLLTPRALQAVRTLLIQSTIWFESGASVSNGCVRAHLADGLYHPIVLQIADKLRKQLPGMLDGHVLQSIWAEKQDQRYQDTEIKVDQGSLHAELWVTPSSANLELNSGGMVVYRTPAPQVQLSIPEVEAWLGHVHDHSHTVRYRENRLIVFHSRLPHRNQVHIFRPGYENRRIRLVFSYSGSKLG